MLVVETIANIRRAHFVQEKPTTAPAATSGKAIQALVTTSAALRNWRCRSRRRRFSSSILARRMASPQELHEVALAPETRLDIRDIGRLLGGAAQGGHAGDEAAGFLVAMSAARLTELFHPFGIDLERLA